MNWELGNGARRLLFYNSESSPDVDVVLMRIVRAYATMQQSGDPEILRALQLCKMIFTSENVPHYEYDIAISMRPCGIYVSNYAISKQIGNQLRRRTGMLIFLDAEITSTVEIGLGGLSSCAEGYVLLKNAFVLLPCDLYNHPSVSSNSRCTSSNVVAEKS